VHAYPRAERALGFLEGVEHGSGGSASQAGDGAADDELEPGTVV
jgi:hypothetical protein